MAQRWKWVSGLWSTWVKWVTIFGWVTWVTGTRVTASDLLTHNDEITEQYSLHFLLLVDIKKLLTHSISPIIIAGGLILIYDIFALKTECHNATPPPSPMDRMK